MGKLVGREVIVVPHKAVLHIAPYGRRAGLRIVVMQHETVGRVYKQVDACHLSDGSPGTPPPCPGVMAGKKLLPDGFCAVSGKGERLLFQRSHPVRETGLLIVCRCQTERHSCLQDRFVAEPLMMGIPAGMTVSARDECPDVPAELIVYR